MKAYRKRKTVGDLQYTPNIKSKQLTSHKSGHTLFAVLDNFQRDLRNGDGTESYQNPKSIHTVKRTMNRAHKIQLFDENQGSGLTYQAFNLDHS